MKLTLSENANKAEIPAEVATDVMLVVDQEEEETMMKEMVVVDEEGGGGDDALAKKTNKKSSGWGHKGASITIMTLALALVVLASCSVGGGSNLFGSFSKPKDDDTMMITINVNNDYVSRRLSAHIFGDHRVLQPRQEPPRDSRRRPIYGDAAGRSKKGGMLLAKEHYLKGKETRISYELNGVSRVATVAEGGVFVSENGCEVGYNLKEQGTSGPYYEVHCCDASSECEVFEAATSRRHNRGRQLAEMSRKLATTKTCSVTANCREDSFANRDLFPVCVEDGNVDKCGCNDDSDCFDVGTCETSSFSTGKCVYPDDLTVGVCNNDNDCDDADYPDCINNSVCGCDDNTACYLTIGTCDSSGGYDGNGQCNACFSAEATVTVKGQQGSISMKDLKVGQYVLTSNNEYQQVYAFAHLQTGATAKFLRIQTQQQQSITDANHHNNKRPLEITGDHLVFKEGSSTPVRADSIKVGDVLKQVAAGSSSSGAKVIRIDTIQKDGMYAPLTKAGTVVVDGIVASTYVSIQDGQDYVTLNQGAMPLQWLSQHAGFHLAFAPFRLMCLGVGSESVCNTYDEDTGMPTYVSSGLKLAKWGEKQYFVVELFLFTLFLVIFAVCIAVEYIFGSTFGAVVMVLALPSYLVLKKQQAYGINFNMHSKNKMI